MTKRVARAWVAGVAWAGVQVGVTGVSLGAGSLVDLGIWMKPHVSADGQVVAGSRLSGTLLDVPYRWTAATGLQELPLPGSDNSAEIFDVNEDGSVIVGEAKQTALSFDEGFKWTAAGGSVGLGGLYARGVTADGKTVAGAAGVGVVTWAEDGTMTPVPGYVGGVVGGMNADGSVMVGFYGDYVTRWTRQDGTVSLPLLPGAKYGRATAVSGDGSTVVGYNVLPTYVVPPGYVTYDYMAFRWTADGGLEDLGHLGEKSPGHYDISAACVNGDGSVIGGYDGGTVDGGFLWDEAHGMRPVREVLTAAGIDLQGWSTLDVEDISADGLTLVGTGYHHGVERNFLVDVPASVWVPEPASVVLLAWGGVMLLGRRCRAAAFI